MNAVVLLIATLLCVAVSAQEDILRLADGIVQGEVTAERRAFRGIPYASPPVGPLRWKDPIPAKPWNGTLNAKANRDGCLQTCNEPKGAHACPLTVSEDCLFLAIYTPRLAQITAPLPIYVYIHGGNFRDGHGGGELYDGTVFANRSKVILVGVNYRLGALGFLGTPGEIAGNYGLRDMILALQWVQRNAAAFGGDRTRVTFGGQSAGAMAAAVLLSVPEARGLFSAVLMESEPFALPLRDTKSMPGLATAFAKYMGCALADVACLRSKSAAVVLDSDAKAATDLGAISSFLNVFLPWSPYVDGKWIKKQPIFAIQDGDFARNIPILIGNTKNEAYLYIYEAFQTALDPISVIVVVTGVLGPARAARALQKYPIPPNSTDTRGLLSDAATDLIFLCSTRNATRNLARYNPVYMYTFDHISSFDEHIWLPEMPECLKHVCHGECLPYAFDSARPFETLTPQESVLATAMNDLFAGFITNGNPNSLQRQQPQWPLYTASTSLSYYFQAGGNRVESFFNMPICDFWDSNGYFP